MGLLYWLVRVNSLAPPLIALAGLLGIVIGEGPVPFVQANLWHVDGQTSVTPSVCEQNPESEIDSHKQS